MLCLVLPNSLPTAGTVIAVATNAVVSALGAVPQIDVTKAASLHEDTAPGQIASSGTMSSPAIAVFQNDVVGLRLRWPITWALRNANAIAQNGRVTWLAGLSGSARHAGAVYH